MSNLLLTQPLGNLLCKTLQLALVIQIHFLAQMLAVAHNQPECHTGQSNKSIDIKADFRKERIQGLVNNTGNDKADNNGYNAAPEPPAVGPAVLIKGI